jgi:hypothetical protein
MTADDEPNPYRRPDAALTKALRLSRVPIGRTARFVEAVRQAKGDKYVRSWLGDLCEFEDCVVWTLDFSRTRINRDCSALIAAHGVVIKAKPRKAGG